MTFACVSAKAAQFKKNGPGGIYVTAPDGTLRRSL